MGARVLPLVSVVVVMYHAATNRGACDQSANTLFREYGEELLRSVPDKPRVLLLTHGDEVINSVRCVPRQCNCHVLAMRSTCG